MLKQIRSVNDQLEQEYVFMVRPVLESRLQNAGPVRLALAAQGVLVKQVLCHLVVLGIHAGKIGNVVTQLLDGLHLLIQVVALQEVTQLRKR